MSEVELRLSQLQEAAERFKRSGLRIDASVQGIRAVINELQLLGFDDLLSSKVSILFGPQQTALDKWPEQLTLFATKLAEASDDLERALLDSYDSYDPNAFAGGGLYSGGASGGFLALLPLFDGIDSPEPVPALLPTDYISGINRPYYDQLVEEQQALKASETRLDELIQTRQERAQDLAALKNRILSMDNTTDLNSIPRVQAMQAEIVRLDQEIFLTKENIGNLQTEIHDLTVRLERIKPGDGADLRLITRLEGSTTSEWIRNHTYGCVNHVVNKMPIPGGISRDAYLWDQVAAQLPQYGITSGNVPLTGSVIVLEPAHSYADDVFGHVLYVENVENGVVWVTDNLHPDTAVRLMDITSEVTGENIKYLYFPWHTQA